MPHPNGPYIVRHPDIEGVLVNLDPAEDYDPADPVVKRYPDFFKPLVGAGTIVESMPVEQATAAPGEKRPRRAKDTSA